jgi:hypothetical protein
MNLLLEHYPLTNELDQASSDNEQAFHHQLTEDTVFPIFQPEPGNSNYKITVIIIQNVTTIIYFTLLNSVDQVKL